MGSVMNYIDCPRCKSESCFEDFYYKSNEIYVSCSDCGYYRSVTWKRDDEGNLVKKDQSKGIEFDNLISEEIHYPEPFGSYRIKMIGDLGSMGGTLVTQEDCDNIIRETALIHSTEKSIDSFVISRYIDGQIVVEVII